MTATGRLWTLHQFGTLHRLTGDYRAAATSQQQALETLCEIGEPAAQGFARNELGLVQQLAGDYRAAATSHQWALRQMRDGDEPYGQACVLNSLGELASRTSATSQAHDHHSQALTIARDIGAPLQQARALEGIGQAHLQAPTQIRPPLTSSRHSRSTSASETRRLSASRKPCADTRPSQPHRNPPTTNAQNGPSGATRTATSATWLPAITADTRALGGYLSRCVRSD